MNKQTNKNVFQMELGDEPMENPQEVITECLSKFSTSDYIMEPGIFSQLKKYVIIARIFDGNYGLKFESLKQVLSSWWNTRTSD